MRQRQAISIFCGVTAILLIVFVGEVFADSLIAKNDISCISSNTYIQSLLDLDINRKGSGDGIIHKFIQKMIDVWLHIIDVMINLMCSLFRTLGYTCR